MNYQTFEPPPLLKTYVREFWVLENGEEEAKTFTVMCNGVPGLIFQQNPAAFTGFSGEVLPQLFVFGQARKHGQLHGAGKFRTIGVTFQPDGLKTIFGIDAAELTDRHISVTHLLKTSLTERLSGYSSVQQQIDLLAGFLLEQTHKHNNDDKMLPYATNALGKGIKLSRVLQDLNLSERSLERLFLTHIGITPILYSRISRFQTALTLLRQKDSLTDIAYSLGYFDQSHFIRDFKLFSGVSPGIYRRNAIEQMPGFPEWQ